MGAHGNLNSLSSQRANPQLQNERAIQKYCVRQAQQKPKFESISERLLDSVQLQPYCIPIFQLILYNRVYLVIKRKLPVSIDG